MENIKVVLTECPGTGLWREGKFYLVGNTVEMPKESFENYKKENGVVKFELVKEEKSK